MGKYQGKIGPAEAMSALDPEFIAAYGAATAKIMDAVLEFERTTKRIVDEISIEHIDITTIEDKVPKHIRQAQIDFLPKPGEISW